MSYGARPAYPPLAMSYCAAVGRGRCVFLGIHFVPYDCRVLHCKNLRWTAECVPGWIQSRWHRAASSIRAAPSRRGGIRVQPTTSSKGKTTQLIPLLGNSYLRLSLASVLPLPPVYAIARRAAVHPNTQHLDVFIVSQMKYLKGI